MKHLLNLVFAFLIFSTFGCDNPQVTAEVQPMTAQAKLASADQFILLGSDEDLSKVGGEVSRAGGQVLRDFEFKRGLVAHVPVQALSGLKKRFKNMEFVPDVDFHLVNSKVNAAGKPGATTPPPQSIPWGIKAIGADKAQQYSTGVGVSVCIVDTGIDRTHADLRNNIIGGRNFIFAKGTLDANRWNDDNGHGSHVAGIVAAENNAIGTVGVAPNAKLYGVKVLDSRGSGSLSGVVDGIYECIQAKTDVINMSLGAAVSPTSSSGVLMQAAVDAARAAGIEVVVAAGNEGVDISGTIPAGLSNLIAVSASDSNGQFPSWSNYGLAMGDYAAPGISIYSTWKSGGYNTISGTSMASPHMAGVAALRISIRRMGYKAKDLGATVSRQGSGLIDALGTVF